MNTSRPTATGTTLAKWSTEALRAELASGWTNLNGVDVAEQVSVMFGATYEMRHNARRRQAAARAALYAAVEALTPERMAAFGAYRLAR
jgi:hypothetical protein